MIELNGTPLAPLSKADIEKYSGKWIFRCGLEYITKSNDPEIAPVSCASVHILPMYQYFIMDGNVRTPKGELRYFENKRYQENNREYHYTPAFISIGYTGSMIVHNDPYLAWFLDNHTYNEAVKADPSHPNHDPSAATYFATYNKIRQVALLEDTLKLKSDLVSRIFDPQQIAFSELKAMATMITTNPAEFKVQHKLFNLPEMTEREIRSEIARMADQNPQAISQIMNSQKIDYLAWVHNFQDVQLIKMIGNEWVISESGKKDIALMKIVNGTDAINSLVDWFQRTDKMGAKFNSLKSKFEAIQKGRKATA